MRQAVFFTFSISFLLAFSGCKTAQPLEQQINTILDEYAAKYPYSEEQTKKEDISLVDAIRRSRQEWSKTMEPYAKRINSLRGDVGTVIAGIRKKDSDEMWRLLEICTASPG